MHYSESFREKMIVKMTGPNGRSANSLSMEVGVAQGTLSRWLRSAKVSPMSDRGSGRRKRRSPSEKIRIVMAAAAAGESGLGELLRREGLHEADIESFREEVLSAAAEGFDARRPKRRGLSPEQKELRAVKKELLRKEKALAETAALLVLRGKVQAFFGADEEGDMDDRNEK
jgi:transposase